MTSFKFSVNGLEAAPQGSKKYIGKGRMIEVSKRVKPWRELVKREASKIKQPPIKGACYVEATFRFKRPKAHYYTNGSLRTGSPRNVTIRRNDLDKLVRSSLDALSGITFVDDSLVTILTAKKRYCEEGEEVGADILVVELEE